VYKDADFNTLLKKRKSHKILDFWEQCTRDAELAGTLPLLIYKNGQIKWVGVCDTFLSEFKQLTDMYLPKQLTCLTYNKPELDVCINFFEFNSFFETVTSEHIKELSKNKKDKLNSTNNNV
jgi:hypothetical protein